MTIPTEKAGQVTQQEMAVFTAHRGSTRQGWRGAFDRLEDVLASRPSGLTGRLQQAWAAP